MCTGRPEAAANNERHVIRPEDSASLSRMILHCASRGLGRADFLHEVSNALMDFSGCDAVEVRLHDGDLHYRWEASRRPTSAARFELVRWTRGADGRVVPALRDDSDLERVCREVALRQVDATRPGFTGSGSFWTGDTWERAPACAAGLCVGGHHRSLAIIRFLVDEAVTGLLLLRSERPGYFAREDVEFFEGAAQTLGLAIADRRAERDLGERVKELTCLYGIARIAEQRDVPLDEMLQSIVALLPPAWQYPEIAAARITLDGRVFAAGEFAPSAYRQSAEIVARGRVRGTVQVVYREERAEFAVGAFLVEEEKLIAAVAREVALLVERTEVEQERLNLRRQLIHADRLATIGQLAAGVAHELNEPLGSILGFAQLARKCPQLPPAAARDLDKIVTASLYAREVIRNLMVFARQVPARKALVDVNQVVEEGLYFLEARCAKAGTRVVRELAPELPNIRADAAQLKQVLVNLVVNAIQAMPQGGTLTIGTRTDAGAVLLTVQDTGTGISPEVVPKIFLPFFTTKEVSEGTGLGLAVVHGIVAAHGGTIDVQTEPGHGARFTIRLPLASAEAGEENT